VSGNTTPDGDCVHNYGLASIFPGPSGLGQESENSRQDSETSANFGKSGFIFLSLVDIKVSG
jgi:hypothetical protein